MPSIGREQRHFWLLTSLLLVFGAVFILRGPMRAIVKGEDFAHIYVAVSLWLQGENPYDGVACEASMRAQGYKNPSAVLVGSFYPPTMPAGLAPLGLLDWPTARLVWAGVNLLSCGVLVWAMADWLAPLGRRRRWWVALLLVLMSGFIATTLSVGQLSLLVGACLCAGIVFLQRDRSGLAGSLIGFACLMKPQMAMGFLVLLALRRDWRVLAFAVAVIAVFSGIGVGRLMFSAPTWLHDMTQNIHASQSGLSVNDASVDAPFRFHLIDMRPLLHVFLPASMVGPIAMGFVVTLAGLALFRLFRIGVGEHLLLLSAGVGLLTLLPIYHRYYDAVLLMPLLAVVVLRLKQDRRDCLMWGLALVLAPMFFPGPTALHAVESLVWFPQEIAETWFWRHVVLVHHAWCMVTAAILLVAWTWLVKKPDLRQRSSESV